jgi:hypothetical protein
VVRRGFRAWGPLPGALNPETQKASKGYG